MPNQNYSQRKKGKEIIFKSTLVTVIFIFPFLTLVYTFFLPYIPIPLGSPEYTPHFFYQKLDKYNLLTRTEHRASNIQPFMYVQCTSYRHPPIITTST